MSSHDYCDNKCERSVKLIYTDVVIIRDPSDHLWLPGKYTMNDIKIQLKSAEKQVISLCT